MKEDDNLLRKVGTGNSFQVPEGYFETLTSEVMSKLPQQEKVSVPNKPVTRWDHIKPWVYMAAMFAGAALIVRVGSSDRSSQIDDAIAIAVDDTTILSDQFINTAIDESMLDDYSLYVYLSDAAEE